MPKAFVVLGGLAALAACSADESFHGAEPTPEVGPSSPQRLAPDQGKAAPSRDIEAANAWVEAARRDYREGAHLDALDATYRALKLRPHHPGALLLRAQMVRDAHGPAQALGWFEAALRIAPRDPEILSEYAATLGEAGHHRKMLGAVRALARLSPDHMQITYLQAVLAARAGEPILAKTLLERSGAVDAGRPAAMLLDAVIDIQGERFASAQETLESLTMRQPANRTISELLARTLWLAGDDKELVRRFEAPARAVDSTPYLAMLVGRALERQGDRGAAAPFLKRAYAGRAANQAIMKGQGPARGSLPEPTLTIRALLDAKRFAEAERYAAALRARFPGSADMASLAADVAMARGQPAVALGLYAETARVRRPWPLTRKAFAAYLDYGDPVAANVLVARHLLGEPRNAEALMLLAAHSAARTDWAEVEELLDNAIVLGAGNDPELLALRARAARESGELAVARRFERLAFGLHPAMIPSH